MAAAQSRGDCSRVGGIARERANAAGVREAYARQVGVSLSSIGRWVRGNGQSGAPGRAGFAAVQLRADPVVAEGAAVKIRWPEGIEVELPLSLGERSLRRCLREVLTCSR